VDRDVCRSGRKLLSADDPDEYIASKKVSEQRFRLEYPHCLSGLDKYRINDKMYLSDTILLRFAGSRATAGFQTLYI